MDKASKYLKYPMGKVVKEYIFIFLGLFPFALMVNWIFVPHNVVGAGLTGICSIIYYATQGFFPSLFAEYGGAIPMWLSTLSINALLLLVAMLTVGWQFCVRTLVGALALAFWYRVIPMRVEPLIADPVTACIVGGVVFGMSLGIVMLIVSGSFADVDTMDLLWKVVYCVAAEAVLTAIACIAVNTVVAIRFDSKGNERRKKARR